MTANREGRLVDAFVRAADTLVADYDVVGLLQQLVDDCVDLLEVGAAGLLLGDQRGQLRLVASTSDDLRLLELFQLQVDQGPCVEAFTTGAAVHVPDLSAASSPWPEFTPQALGRGFRSVHAVPLRLRTQVIGALGLFDPRIDALGTDDLRVAQALADVATIGVLHQRVITSTEALNEQLQTALNTRVVIEQAKGVLAERGGLDMGEAFTRLRGYARRHQSRLSDVARGVIDGSLDSRAVLGDRDA
ncbi:GAF and ANTAR domain-containing protein [Rhodococcus antarcticus]|jgi:transcriptional regulator with GAF, ATPase, and Fis domain|uniref:GAF and ANTAR domain-containing protein n=1 Tax=Rhodococcus antarcticus TaxID=2987751 RepID=A0ABY6NYS0_9NOCA|nr:GAF and ANTAR domain-containing protein [Rhodococcus antarcticus]UZJ24191.1 GAF and ANTAR domain-containing protein [Rhodococcus antarcticus]